MRGLYWVRHAGDDVYHGAIWLNEKISYHGSGRIHHDRKGSKRFAANDVPLKGIKGHRLLQGMAFGNDGHFFTEKFAFMEHAKRKKDLILVLDSRVIPSKAGIGVTVWLIESGNMESVRALTELKAYETLPKQVMLSCATNPWVGIAVFWSQARK